MRASPATSDSAPPANVSPEPTEIAMLPPAPLVAAPLAIVTDPEAPLVVVPVDTEMVGETPTPDTLVATVTAPVDVLNAPVLPLKSIAFDPLAATAPENVVVPDTPSVELSVAAPVSTRPPSVAAPVTPSVDVRVTAPVTPRVELSVAAPVTPSVELSVVGCAIVTSVSPNVATATAFVPMNTLPCFPVPLPAPPITLREPPVLVDVVASPPFTSTKPPVVDADRARPPAKDTAPPRATLAVPTVIAIPPPAAFVATPL